jgi:hypothetical protein
VTRVKVELLPDFGWYGLPVQWLPSMLVVVTWSVNGGSLSALRPVLFRDQPMAMIGAYV